MVVAVVAGAVVAAYLPDMAARRTLAPSSIRVTVALLSGPPLQCKARCTPGSFTPIPLNILFLFYQSW